MSNFKLNLPTDIPWERICVTEDMIDRSVCDRRSPAKWQTSLAVFKYKPEEEYQLYPKYDITYLKITATITGYQPLDQEIQGTVNWSGVNVATIPGLTDLLNSYNPCHGAILQVTVGPHTGPRTAVAVGAPGIPSEDYPFFMDFEPKKRELYELATDTKEKQSRSIESLNITKSAGTTQSLESFDVDMGGGGGGGSVQVFGTGGGFNYAGGNGQWGTKRLNAEESMSSRSTDVGIEKRETYSFTTQISQMYHLLDSYHIGTNRVVFFIQPRPHTLEEPSGFVRGPRPVDGIQEFFMVVAQLKDQDGFCVSLRLDTSHLTKTPIMDFERRTDMSDLASANAPIPNKNDTMAERKALWEACFFDCWDVYYQCYVSKAVDDKTYQAPAGFEIESYDNLVNDDSHGSSNVTVTPDNKSLNIHAEAQGHICYEDSFGCVDCPDELQKWSGYARRQVQVNLVSTEPIKQVGEQEVLMITTRGLCCCSTEDARRPMEELVVGIKRVPSHLTVKAAATRNTASVVGNNARGDAANVAGRRSRQDNAYERRSEANREDANHKDGTCKDCADKAAHHEAESYDPKFTIRQVNELSNYIKTEALRSLNDPNVKLQKFVDTEFFTKQLEYRLLQFRKGRELLNESIGKELPRNVVAALAKHLKKDADKLTRQDVISIRNEELANIAGLKPEDVPKIKLVTMGVKYNEGNNSDNKKSAG